MSTIVKVRRGPLATIPTAEAGEFLTTSDTHQAFFGDGAVNYELAKITDLTNGGTFDVDLVGDLEPSETVNSDIYFEADNGDLQPKEA
jgi:hypothetical protein